MTRYKLTATIAGDRIAEVEIPNPFVTCRVEVGSRWSLFRGLLRGRLLVVVAISEEKS